MNLHNRISAVIADLAHPVSAAPERPLKDRIHGVINDLSGSDTASAASHFERRKPTIAEFQSVLDRYLAYACHETLRNLEEARAGKQPRAARIILNVELPVHAAGVSADIVFDLSRFASGLLAALRGVARTALGTATAQCLHEIRAGLAPGRDDAFELPDPAAIAYLDRRENLLKDIPNEIHSQIKEELNEGITAGESMADLTKRITSTFEDIGKSRAKTIASTETAAAYGFARHESMVACGITRKSWLTSHLPNVRVAHAMAEDDSRNQKCPVDQPFEVGGEKLMYPGDPDGSAENVINCHCVEIAEADSDPEGRY